jgi:OPA family sugar phosphate sensor protein UhpC-like MFS transporter
MRISTFTKSECGIAWSFCSTANPIGGAIAAFMIAYIASNYNWELGFIIPGLLSMIAGIWLFYKNPYENSHRIIRKSMKNKISMKSFMKLVYTELLCNKLIWILSISYYFIYLIRTAFSDWLILFLIEQKNYMISNALGYACCFELGGVLGMILSGVISDLVLNSNRVKLSITSYILLIIIVASIYFIPVTWKFELYFLIFFLGVCIFCITTLIGLAAAEITEGRLASSANGLVGMFSYIGAGVAGYPLGLLIEVYGWQYFVFSIVCSCVIALVILKQLSTL